MTKLLIIVIGAYVTIAGCQVFWQGPAEPPMAGQIQLNGTGLTYIEQGQGTPVVFVHGEFSDYRIWDMQREIFARRYRYVAVNLRYHGTAPWPDDAKNYSVTTHAADLVAFIRALNVGPVHLVGRSYGSNVVEIVALEHPELVRSVVIQEPYNASLIDPEARAVFEDLNQSFAPIMAAAKEGDAVKATRLFAEWANNTGPGSFEQRSESFRSIALDNARTVPPFLAALRPSPVTCEQLGRLKPSALIINGANTRRYFAVISEALSRCIPGARRAVIADATHSVADQNPTAFNEAVLSFLEKN